MSINKHGPVSLWFFNGSFDPQAIRLQLDELADKGFSAAAIHPRDGLTIPYLSPRWFEAVAFILAEAAKRELGVWFYDEYPFPSGTAGGMVTDLHPDLIGHTLAYEIQQVAPRDNNLRTTFKRASRLLRIYATPVDAGNSPEAPSRNWVDITEHAALVMDHWFVQGERSKAYGPTYLDDKTDPHWRSWGDKEHWTLEWRVPDSRLYRVMAVWRVPGRATRPGYYVDLLNPVATEKFIELTYQKSLEKLGPELFGEFRAAFTDEPMLCGPFPWTGTLPEDYRKAFGRELPADLPLLLDDDGSAGNAARLRYRRLLGRLWKERFWNPLADWCRRHRIPFTGHASPEEDPLMQATMATGLMQAISTMDYPGCDQITTRFEQLRDEMAPKLASSVAHQHGRDHVTVETLGVTGDGITIGRMRRILDHLAMCGCDKFVFHGQFMSLAGVRKREAPPSIFVQQPYWRFMGRLSEHLARWARWHGRGEPHRPIALLYPTAAFEARPPGDDRAARWAARLEEMIGRLLRAGLDFDLLSDVDLINPAFTRFEAGMLHVGRARYQTLVLPDIPLLDEPTCDHLAAWTKQGLDVLSLSASNPIGLDAPITLGAIQENADALIRRLIERHRDWLDVPADATIYAQSRMMDGVIRRALWNPSDTPARPRLTRTGDIIELDAGEVVFIDNDQAPPSKIDTARGNEIALSEPWILTPLQPNALRLSRWRLHLPDSAEIRVEVPAKSNAKKDLSESGCDDDRIKGGYFPPTPNGSILETEFELQGNVEDLRLNWDVECFAAPVRLWINEQEASLTGADKGQWFDSLSMSIAHLARNSTNRVRLSLEAVPDGSAALTEPLYLCGRFQVTDIEPPTISAGDRVELARPGDWSAAGFPHYSGPMKYSTTFENPPGMNRLWFEAPPGQQDPFEVFLNGQSVGTCCWTPWRLELTGALRAGTNHLEVIVANTLINQVEGVPQPSGLLGTPRLIA